MKMLAIVIGMVVIGIGVFLGASSLEAQGGGESFVCGPAFSPALGAAEERDHLNRLIGKQTNFGDACRSERDSRKVIAFAGFGLGMAILVGGVSSLAGNRRPPSRRRKPRCASPITTVFPDPSSRGGG